MFGWARCGRRGWWGGGTLYDRAGRGSRTENGLCASGWRWARAPILQRLLLQRIVTAGVARAEARATASLPFLTFGLVLAKNRGRELLCFGCGRLLLPREHLGRESRYARRRLFLRHFHLHIAGQRKLMIKIAHRCTAALATSPGGALISPF